MSELIPYFIGLIGSGLIFVSLSIKLGWSKKLWSVLDKKINPNYGIAIWVILGGITQGILGTAIELSGLDVFIGNVILGSIMGVYLAFLPSIKNMSKK